MRGIPLPHNLRISFVQHPDWQRHGIALLSICGGCFIVAGTLLPWFSLFADLQVYAGIAGLNGWLLLGGGVLCILTGAWFLLSGGRRLRWWLGLLGFALLAFASWILVSMLQTLKQLSTDPLMLAQLGPGLVVTVAGALLVFATLFL